MHFCKTVSVTTLATLCSLALFSAETAHAQSGSRNGSASAGGGGGGVGGGAGGGSTGGSADGFSGSGETGAATPQESILRGQADFVRSFGAGAKDASEAAINIEIARSKAIENRIEIGNAQNSVIRSSIERERLRHEYYQTRRESRVASLTGPLKGNVPARLSSHHTSSSSGLHWPRSLRTKAFKPYRNRIEVLFARMNEGDIDAEQQIRETSRQLLTKLKRQQSQLSVNNYIAGKKFLNGLWVETFYTDQDMHHQPMMASN